MKTTKTNRKPRPADSPLATPTQLAAIKKRCTDLPGPVAARLDPESPSRLTRREATELLMSTAGVGKHNEAISSVVRRRFAGTMEGERDHHFPL